MAYHPSAFCDRRRQVAAFFVSVGLAVSSLIVPWFASTASASTPVVTSYTGTGISAPNGITAGPDGALWFTNENNNSIGRITTGANPSPTTSILSPSNGATLSGSTTLDASASNATSVEFWLFGGSYGFSGHLVGTATSTLYGWLDSWNTTTVPNGSYTLVSEAFNSTGSAFSSGVNITVHNVPARHSGREGDGFTFSNVRAQAHL